VKLNWFVRHGEVNMFETPKGIGCRSQMTDDDPCRCRAPL
jgi:hypothetical protein